MVIALLFVLLAPAIAQDQDKSSKPPGRGDVVVARGCLRGTSFEKASVTKVEAEDGPVELFTYRLTGDKKMMETLRKKHNGHADVLTAELATDLPTSRSGGKVFGNTRITIGASRGMAPEPPPAVPVLRVTAIEHTGVTCR